jgi:hypothetical protein
MKHEEETEKCKLLVGKPQGRIFGKLKLRWEEHITVDLR